MRTWFTQLVDRWMPPSLARATPERQSTARTVLAFNAIIFAAGTSYTMVYLALWMPVAAAGAGTAMLVATVLPLWFHRTGDTRGAGHGLALTAVIALVGVTLGTGGLSSPATSWFLLAPMIPAMVGGRRSGLPWVGVCLMWFALLYGLWGAGVAVPDQLPGPNYVALYRFIVPAGLLLALFAFAWSYEVAREDALQRIRAIGVALEVSRDHAEAAHAAARQLLDTIGEGLLLVQPDGRVEPEYSAAVTRFVAAPRPGQTLWQLFEPLDATFAEWLALAWEDLSDDWMPVEVIVAQLPDRIRLGDRHVQLAYTPVMHDDRLVRVLVTMSDITAAVLAEEAAAEQRETMAVFTRMLHDPRGVRAFFDEAELLVHRITSAHGNRAQEARWVHTLKGNCAVFGLTRTATWLHELEERMSERGALDPTTRHELGTQWQAVLDQVGPVLDTASEDTVRVPRTALEATLALAEAGAPGAELAPRLRAWTWRRVDLQLDQLADQARVVAARMGKGHTTVVVDVGDEQLRVPPTPAWGALFASLVHLVRNAIDHGIETEDKRSAAGKDARAELCLRADAHGDELWIDVQDDGAGIDWERIREVNGSDRPFSSHAERVRALFADGVTSREEVSELSGRGVGTAAVWEAVRRLQGEVEVSSQPGRGTRVRLRVPCPTLGRLAPSHAGYREERAPRAQLA